ncbi:hypothetical protein FEM48_Zijuj01G0100000 [Ziziphus jujuba var. spinosa]|uniref:WPP domain-associated protein n=1 Tax=Ziziphus jujuba var. spinosa TaxID=714518 RepID=A0A978W0L2_ZIZJJ|nr:hypothetical protein FEM48_Zijuj01G0100000 [Ziziphus jujuba var. spinosa]
MESLIVMDAAIGSSTDGCVQLSSNAKDNENLGDQLVEDWDSYWQDISDRLTISRMVSDSVIKGMVNAVSQEAAEKIAQKELEVAGMKEMLHFYHVATDDNVPLGSLALQHESKGTKVKMHCSFSEAVVEHDRMKETLSGLKNTTDEQFKKLKKDVNQIRGSSSIKKIRSSSELLGLGGILHEKESERWHEVDRTFASLKTSLDMVYKQVEEMVHSSKASLCKWQSEQEFQAEIEAMVIGNCIRSLEQEFEEKLWDKFCGDKSINLLGMMNEISSLRQELDAISKSLIISDVGQLSSHASFDSEEWNNSKKSDHFHCKLSSNHATTSSSIREENGKHEESQTNVLENSDPHRFKDMTKEQVRSYYCNEMSEMKRNHESKVQEMTEKYFSLKREFLKERWSSLPSKKDKEFDILRKRIPEVILKLDGILTGNEKIPLFDNNADSLCSLKNRLEMLPVENRRLRDFLTDKKKEIKCLESQLSDAELKISTYSSFQAKLLNRIENLEDVQLEASIGEDVFNCIVREMMGQIKCGAEDSNLEYSVMKDIFESIFKEAAHNAKPASQCQVEDADMQSVIMQGLSEFIYREAWKDAEEKLNYLNMKYMDENETRVSYEEKLKLAVTEKQRLRQEILFFTREKEKLAQASATALEEIEQYKMDIGKLNQKLEQVMNELRVVDEERRKLLADLQEKQNVILLCDANEREIRKQVESVIVIVNGLFKAAEDFEWKVTDNIFYNCLRLKKLDSQSRFLIQKANILRRTGLLYKQRLDRKCSDLQKAEAEVDLLGDKVDALSSLLEKIYIALDHYSPILQHYPGIVEILKLVKRELSGESTRSV